MAAYRYYKWYDCLGVSSVNATLMHKLGLYSSTRVKLSTLPNIIKTYSTGEYYPVPRDPYYDQFRYDVMWDYSIYSNTNFAIKTYSNEESGAESQKPWIKLDLLTPYEYGWYEVYRFGDLSFFFGSEWKFAGSNDDINWTVLDHVKHCHHSGSWMYRIPGQINLTYDQYLAISSGNQVGLIKEQTDTHISAFNENVAGPNIHTLVGGSIGFGFAYAEVRFEWTALGAGGFTIGLSQEDDVSYDKLVGAGQSTSVPGIGISNVSGTSLQKLWVDGAIVTIDIPSFVTGDTVCIAYAAELGFVWFGKNGVFFNNGNPYQLSNCTVAYHNPLASLSLKIGVPPACEAFVPRLTADVAYAIPQNYVYWSQCHIKSNSVDYFDFYYNTGPWPPTWDQSSVWVMQNVFPSCRKQNGYQYSEWKPFDDRYLITGIARRKGVPCERHIGLLERDSLRLIDATYSDPVTGRYDFRVDNKNRYMVIELDDSTEDELLAPNAKDLVVPTYDILLP